MRKAPQLPNAISAAQIVEIAGRHGARRVRVFGSRAFGEASPESDLDLLVELKSGRDLFDLVGLKHDLEGESRPRVDGVTEKALSPYLRDEILRRAVPL